ncbi:hypothetical protein D3C78_1866200 [compost metagenome]
MEFDAGDFVRVQCRRQRVIIQFENAAQQIPFCRIGTAEQHHIGIEVFNRYQRPIGEFKTLDHV